MFSQTDSQTDRQRGKQAERQTDRETDAQADTDRQTDRERKRESLCDWVGLCEWVGVLIAKTRAQKAQKRPIRDPKETHKRPTGIWKENHRITHSKSTRTKSMSACVCARTHTCTHTHTITHIHGGRFSGVYGRPRRGRHKVGLFCSLRLLLLMCSLH